MYIIDLLISSSLLYIISAIFIIFLLIFVFVHFKYFNSYFSRKFKRQQQRILLENKTLKDLNDSLRKNRKELEILNNELNAKNTELEKKEKELIGINQTKDKLFSIISHDLRNPIASIISLSRLLKRNYSDYSKEEMLHLMEDLESVVLRMNTLLENLLQWSRLNRGSFHINEKNIRISKALEEVISLMEYQLKAKSISIENNLSENLFVYADRNVLEVIFRNLLSNAIKFSHPESKIILSSKIDSENYCVIMVQDFGLGMDQEDVKQLFNAETIISTVGTANEKGSGLGLQLVKELIDKSNARITVESVKDKGSTFYVYLQMPKLS